MEIPFCLLLFKGDVRWSISAFSWDGPKFLYSNLMLLCLGNPLMRSIFFEMGLLNDASFMNNVSFIWNGKGWGESKREGEREREIK
jgi:hypothetical protein